MIFYIIVGVLVLGVGFWISEQLMQFGFEWWFISYHPYMWMGDIVKVLSGIVFIVILIIGVIRSKGNKLQIRRG